ncbi:hypothetical protein M0R04_12990 [Candidatus Dojkabacteria bacterium]|jgi:hypothetical protein|nr:hypothetical protein [Candidatus Dojkabacteria bacterium]
MATLTVYPDANPETNTVDATISENTDETLANKIAAASGTSVNPSSTSLYVYLESNATSQHYAYLQRTILLFDTSALPTGATISAAKLGLYVVTSADGLTGQTFNIVSSAPASNNDVVVGDYDSLGTTKFSSDINVGGQTTSAYLEISLNAAGIATISDSGITKLGLRLTSDGLGGSVTWAASQTTILQVNSADGTNKPYLEITYSTGIAYSMDCTVGAFTLTGNNILVSKTLNASLSVGQFTLTGINILVSKVMSMFTSVGQFALTGNNITVSKTLHALTTVGQFTLTGINILTSKAMSMFTAVGQFILTGYDIVMSGTNIGWTFLNKNTTTYTNQTKNTTNYTNQSKSSTAWNYQNKNV